MESFIVGKKPLTVRRTGFIEQPLELEAKRVQDPNRGQKWSATGQSTNQNPHYDIFSLAAAPTSCDQRLSLNVARPHHHWQQQTARPPSSTFAAALRSNRMVLSLMAAK
ncbi:hypothetical protein QC761_0065360 [Podospora bellae-mahoneyi]|uniref:Uncharacterized protein n=1 Tax=Podospora bellae-mahoneyi TaxID=2093777 RepID=A0ABR0FJC6_9PEZI|nr:hypothetical protein QC761_0065360 [Podospora bellae-mahoneyi]